MTPPSDNPVLLAFGLAVLTSLLWRAFTARPRGHRYRSTACHHGHHERCRVSCKFCDAQCVCPCHRLVSVAPAGKSAA